MDNENCKLYQGDCLNVIDKLIKNGIQVDLIITDPPYKTTKRGISSKTNTGGLVRSELGKQGKIFKHNDITPEEFIPKLYEILKPNSHCYIMTNHVNLQRMLNVATDCGFHFIKCLIWDKGNKIMGQCYMSQYEYILFLRKGKHKKINNCGTSDIISIPNKKTKNNNGKNLHDTEKPVDLMKILIKNSSLEGDLVLDSFMGIGSTGIACMRTNRNFIGIELDENYFNIATQRIESQFYGSKM